MPEIKPFAGTRYNPAKVRDMSRVIAPPYDVIDPEYHSELLSRDPHNVVRLILGSSPGSAGDYGAGAALMSQWLEDKTLINDPEPSYYIIQDTYRIAGCEKPINRWGIIGRVRLEPFDSGHIFPHERTHSRPKEDRLRLMRAFHGNLSQVLALFDGDSESVHNVIEPVFRDDPAVDLVDSEGIRRQLWVVTNSEITQKVSDLLAERNLYIADGHHRYETALTYSREMAAADPTPSPDKGYNFVMMALVGMRDPGLTIFPIHRLFHGLDNFQFENALKCLSRAFTVSPLSESESALLTTGPTQSTIGGRGFLLFNPSDGRFLKAVLRKDVDLASHMPEVSVPVRQLEVTLVEKFLMIECLGMDIDKISRQEHLEYFQDLKTAQQRAREYGQLLVIMPPTNLDDLVDVTSGRERMPQKSTFFFPKLLSGLVFYSHGH